ncbi:(Lyso)-N-acylphosphatidylethanolamine lipase [Paralichthys olivaceus]|uniref:(Lyso)-N-acylphosphatidylethanolamine lipase n=1 Tax=Paralichthys olivaceus TaxID=8255 RepID=UPI00097D9B21|nr:PREDICTED: protein ABHD4 [Paralichthys olivaceus]
MDPASAPMQSDCETEPNAVWSWWPSWRPTSMSLLKTTESRILACIKNDLWARFVTLPNQDRLWTLTLTNKMVRKPAAPKTPLVMVHGFGGGVGLWIRNLDALSRSRPIYAFDLLGFGRSSRPPFPSDAAKAEEQFVESIEQWRQSVGLENMILLGHSLGGYLATSYAIQYPSRVSHLILVDPWGFPERPNTQIEANRDQGTDVVRRSSPPRWVKVIAAVVSLFNPLAVIRAAGPWGPGLVNRFRPDFKRKFEDLFDDDTMTQYIYHCNAQTPSGEVGFRVMSESLGWAKRPMLHRVDLLPPSMPLTMLYGESSWVDSSSGDRVIQIRNQANTKLLLINKASHHLYADQPEEFNRVVENICNSVN